MPRPPKHVLIGSTEAYSGKSGTILGLAFALRDHGIDIAYGKPMGTCLSESTEDRVDEDVRFIAQTLELPESHIRPTLFSLDEATLERQLTAAPPVDYRQQLSESLDGKAGELVLLEGPGTLTEGTLFHLSLPQLAEAIDAPVILVARFHSVLVVDGLLAAKRRLGDRLMGVIINDVPLDRIGRVTDCVQPFLERQGVPVLGILPSTALMRSISVGELVQRLDAEVLCCSDRMDLMVESLTIGAMNVNSALKYFRKATNLAVVTGGDRADIQLAALETSTQCLILTGHLPPMPQVLSRATDIGVPMLSVDLDTLTTVEIVDQAFGQVRLHEPIKVQCIRHLMGQHFDIARLLKALNLSPALSGPAS